MAKVHEVLKKAPIRLLFGDLSRNCPDTTAYRKSLTSKVAPERYTRDLTHTHTHTSWACQCETPDRSDFP